VFLRQGPIEELLMLVLESLPHGCILLELPHEGITGHVNNGDWEEMARDTQNKKFEILSSMHTCGE
jgi:hypothetical protein